MVGRGGAPRTPDHTARIRMHSQAGAVVVSISGEIDAAATVGLRYVVSMALQAPADTPIVVDLTEASPFATAGLQTLADAHRDAGDDRQPLRIVLDRARPAVSPIQVTGLAPALALYDALDDALTAKARALGDQFSGHPSSG